MKLGLVTSSFPMGPSEPFAIPEVEALQRIGYEVSVVPVRPAPKLVHGDAEIYVRDSHIAPPISPSVLGAALGEAIADLRLSLGSIRPVFRSRSAGVLIKNAYVIPKALWLADIVKRKGIQHIHAYWASVPATVAMVASHVAQVPWSFTAHRWDIAEDNLLGEKSETASFIRAIDIRGAQEIEQTVGRTLPQLNVVHVGVKMPKVEIGRKSSVSKRGGVDLRVITPANFVEKKGHAYLVEAAKILAKDDRKVHFDLVGDGPLREGIEQQASGLNLMSFLGQMPHSELMARMRQGEWDVLVLPSIVDSQGEREGIPVSLMEAMSYGLPVVSTDTGGISELLHGGAGMMVSQRDPHALAEAVSTLIDDVGEWERLSKMGRQRVEESFSATRTAEELDLLFRTSVDAQ